MTDTTTAAPAAAPAAPGTTAAPAAPAAATTTTAVAPSGNWYDGFPEETKGYVQNKGWKDPSATVESYRNLEKLVGAPPEQIIKLPKSDAPPEAWNDVWNRLGRPTEPKGYGFQAPEGDTSGFSDWAGKTFHELGIPESMGKQLAAKFGEFQQSVMAKQQEGQQANVAAEASALKTKWGAAHDQNVGVARMAAQNLGLDGATIDGLESVMGFAKVMELFHTLGSRMGEGNFVTGGTQGVGGILSPEQAMNKIQALRRDPEWSNKYLKGDAGARAEMEKLHKWAYPG
jgi:hypothetical protein